MRVRLGFLFIVLVLSVAPSLGNSVYRLPQVANGDGVIQTTFVFLNNGNEDAEVDLHLSGADGAPMDFTIPGLAEGSPKRIHLPAGQTRFYASDGHGELRVGAARVESNVDIGVTAIFSILGADGFTLVTEAGVGVSIPTTEFAIAVDTEFPFNTGVALFNLGGDPSEVTFELFDSAGRKSGDPVRRTLPARGHLAVFVGGIGGLFPDLGNFKGRLAVKAASQVAAVTLRQNVRTGAPLTTLPVVPVSSLKTSFNLPHIANGFAGSLGIKTQFIVFSLGAGGTVNLTTSRGDGQPFPLNLSNGRSGSDFQMDLPAGGALFVETDGLGDIEAGAARITSSVPIGVTAVFSLLDTEGNVTVEAGVGDSLPLYAFTIPVDARSGFDTGVALFNNNPEPANVAFEFFGLEGNWLHGGVPQTASLVLDPGGHGAKFVSEIFEALATSQGQMAIRSDQPLAALSLRQGATTLTTLPVTSGAFNPDPGPAPSPANLLPRTLENVSVTADTTLDIQLPAGFRLGGRVDMPFGFFPYGEVQAIDPTGEVYSGSVSGFWPSFNYSVLVPEGTFVVRACGIRYADLDEQLGTILSHTERAIVTADTTRNLQVPPVSLRTVSGRVLNLDRLPPGTLVEDETWVAVAYTSVSSPSLAVFELEDLQGEYKVNLAPGAYQVHLVFGERRDTGGDWFADDLDWGSILWGSLLYEIAEVSVGGADMTGVDIPLPEVIRLTGSISQPRTTDFSTSWAYAFELRFPANSAITQCIPIATIGGGFVKAEADGGFVLSLVKDQLYDLVASVPPPSGEGRFNAPLPGSLRRSFTTDGTLDIALPDFPPEVTLSGRVTGPTGQPVAGAVVTALAAGGLTGASDASFGVGTVTDEAGGYSLRVLSGINYRIEAHP